MWFVNPIFYKSSEDVYRYFIENNLKRSGAYDILGFSGECMCGSFAQKDEALLLKQVDPYRFDMIEWITDGIKRFGSPEAKRHAKWGDTSDFDDIRNQQILNLFFNEDEMKHIDKMAVNACGSECGAGTMKGMMGF